MMKVELDGTVSEVEVRMVVFEYIVSYILQ
jgi:hypothetical protein